MRQIGTLDRELDARRFSAYLSRQKIENSVDASFDPHTERASYAIWVHNEDQLSSASLSFERFVKTPSDPEFNVPIPEQVSQAEVPLDADPAPPPRPIARATSFLLALCALIFFLNGVQELSLREKGFSEENFLITPLQVALLYDAPPALERLEAAAEVYAPPAGQKAKELPSDVRAEIDAFQRTPFFQGIYAWIVAKLSGQPAEPLTGPLFYKISQGEIWRLFTPCILHAGLLHIAFNMIWLWILGRQIESRIGWMRYLLLTIVIGVIANTIQYLMSGPFFLGYSGIVTGLAGFIWSREKIAPWEGYPLQRSMLLFLALFVLAMFVLQFGSLLLLLFTSVQFAPNIANAAHIGGAIVGALLGRLSFFDVRGGAR